MATNTLAVVVLLGLLSLTTAYKPVIMVHGLLGYATEFTNFTEWIEEVGEISRLPN
jgi:hypothetical protein